MARKTEAITNREEITSNARIERSESWSSFVWRYAFRDIPTHPVTSAPVSMAIERHSWLECPLYAVSGWSPGPASVILSDEVDQRSWRLWRGTHLVPLRSE